MTINEVNKIIDAIKNTPARIYSKEQAQEILRSCGILDDDNNIVPAYQEILKPIVDGGNK